MADEAAGRFASKTYIITGAGSGIGKATAQRLLAEGARVVAADISQPRLAELAASFAGGVTVVAADISCEPGVESVVDACDGIVHGLVNNAGIMDGFLTPLEIDDSTWNRVMAVNLEGPMRLTRAVLPLMIRAGGGAIVNVASEAGMRGSCAGVAYTASKHALIGYTRSVAVFHRSQGVRCNAIAPGGVITNVDGSFRSATAAQVIGPILQACMPAPASAEQVASTIAYLLSDDASNVNGAVVACDGGWSAV